MIRTRYFLNYFIVIVLSSFFIATSSLSLDNSSSNEILVKIDSYRVPLTEGQIHARLIEFKNNEIDNKSTIMVSFNNENDSLIEFLDSVKKGQKVLLTNRKILLFLPRSRRVICLTPLQRIMGQASYGDIARSSWAGDYDIKSVVDVSESEQKLELVANKNLEYEKIVLRIQSKSKVPIKADFFLKSGKLFKSAEFYFSTDSHGEKIIKKIVFFEDLKNNKKTVLFFDKLIDEDISDDIFRVR